MSDSKTILCGAAVFIGGVYATIGTVVGCMSFRDGYIYGFNNNDYTKYSQDRNNIMRTTFKCLNGLYYGTIAGVSAAILSPIIMLHAYSDWY
jgi:hypothetical protein